MTYENLQLIVARDYKHLAGRYEFILMADEEIVLRQTGFKSKAAAQRAGIKAARPLLAETLF